MKRTVVLCVLDGWGIGRNDESNPIYTLNPPNISYIRSHFPSGALQASGIAVGLPWGEEGNSEVGHLTMGAGKVLYQHYPRITLSIRGGDFFNNLVLRRAFSHARNNKSAVNLIGLLTDANIHASFEHLVALLDLAAREGIKQVKLHLFTDGRDSPIKSVTDLLKKVDGAIAEKGVGRITSLSGRYYSMERDLHWDRTEAAYKAIVEGGADGGRPEAALKNLFDRGLSEEFLDPLNFGGADGGIKDGEAIIFFNFREDGIRQLAEAFIDPEFSEFSVKRFKNAYICSMTQYKDRFTIPVAFPSEKVDNPLGRVISDHQKAQLRVSETDKYAHVTYFFNGFRDTAFTGEYRVLIPSRNVTSHEEFPEMMAAAITDRIIGAVSEGAFDFILVNYANPDVLAHTGNYDATLKAIKTVDDQVGALLKTTLGQDGVLLITSDHGNAERLRNPLTYAPETKHDLSPVPIYLVAKEFQVKKSEFSTRLAEAEGIGVLADIAPTVLELMGLPKPEEMTGQSLLPFLK